MYLVFKIKYITSFSKTYSVKLHVRTRRNAIHHFPCNYALVVNNTKSRVRATAICYRSIYNLARKAYFIYSTNLFLAGVESIKQNLTTEELKTSPSSLDSSREGVLYGVRNVASCTGLSATVKWKRKNKQKITASLIHAVTADWLIQHIHDWVIQILLYAIKGYCGLNNLKSNITVATIPFLSSICFLDLYSSKYFWTNSFGYTD